MEKVNVTFTWSDGVFDIKYYQKQEVYQIDENYIVCKGGETNDDIDIEPITSEINGK